ncbi:MAG: hypothetical protein ACLQNE_46320 [Thermoguttaceae bacterium]
MPEDIKKTVEEVKKRSARPTVSTTLSDGSLVETLYRPEEHQTLFCIWRDGDCRYENSLFDNGRRLVPYSPDNNLIANEVVLLPSGPEEYGSDDTLITGIQSFIHRYVDVTPTFEKLASYYILFTWVYDGFNELPYLRVRGDFGSGKTRFLLTVGSLCYKPIFASGASTVSPLFRILDAFRGTLLIDEGDFRMSDERAEVVKILNNGNARGFPVLRSEVTGKREFDPRAYIVFGPKLVATRGFFDDRALESRFITEEMGQYRLRNDIPINLPSIYKEEALHLRNKLLLFRFRNLHKRQAAESLVDRSVEPRLNQIFVPLLSIIEDTDAREGLRDLARRYNRELIADRGMDMEAQILEVIRDLIDSSEDGRIAIKDITSMFAARHEEEYDKKITPKWIGGVIRKRLHLKSQKSHGVFVIAPSERPKLDRLYERFGIDLKDGNGAEPQPAAGQGL